MNDDGTVRTVKSKPAIGVPDLVVEVGRIFRFGLVGVLATLVYALTAAVAVDIFLIPPVPASILAQAMSAGVSYVGIDLHVSSEGRPPGLPLALHDNCGSHVATTVGVTWFCTDIADFPSHYDRDRNCLNPSHQLRV